MITNTEKSEAFSNRVTYRPSISSQPVCYIGKDASYANFHEVVYCLVGTYFYPSHLLHHRGESLEMKC